MLTDYSVRNGIGVYFNPAEGQEMMAGFNAIVSGLQKHGEQLTDDEGESLRALAPGRGYKPRLRQNGRARVWRCLDCRRVLHPARDGS
jgi:hypothetical protein